MTDSTPKKSIFTDASTTTLSSDSETVFPSPSCTISSLRAYSDLNLKNSISMITTSMINMSITSDNAVVVIGAGVETGASGFGDYNNNPSSRTLVDTKNISKECRTSIINTLTPTVTLSPVVQKKSPRPQPLRLWSETSRLFFILAILFVIITLPPVTCDRFFTPRHVANVQPLASYLMSTFPGAFSSSASSSIPSQSSSSSSSSVPASALTTSGLGVVSLLPVSLPYISTNGGVNGGSMNSFAAHSFGGGSSGGGGIGNECEYNGNTVMDVILDRMRNHLTEEKIVVQNGAITIYDASIVRFVELSRLRNTCIRKLDPTGNLLAIPFEAEIRSPQVAARLKYNFYVTDIYGDYAGNFSHIRMNGTLEANLDEEYLTVADFNITDSQVVGDSIVFSYVPKWILDWVRSYFDSDNTELYQHLAKSILQREADTFRHFDMIREAMLIGEAQREQNQQTQQQLMQMQQQQQQLLQSLANPHNLMPTMQARGDHDGGEPGEDRRMPLNRI